MSQRLGRYETIRQIASGGMATVFLGRVSGEGGFERLVALKVMHPHLAADPDFVGMFLDEARLAARIRHPNVVATIDIQKSDERMFLVMEYIEGAALSAIRRHLRKQKRTVPLGVMLRIMLDTLGGLHAAHELTDDYGQALNLVHRDVSPQNILVGNDGVARITDFGVARAEVRINSTRGGQLKGKLPYMPPEQLLNQGIDRRADVYSAGVVLWELLVGRRLFTAANEGAMVHDIVGGELPSPHDTHPDVPLAISEVCMRAISRKPADRYPTAAVFADALEDAAQHEGLRPTRPRKVGEFVENIRVELPADHPQMAPIGGSIPPTLPPGAATSTPPAPPPSDSIAPGPIAATPASGPLPTPATHTDAAYATSPPHSRGKSKRGWVALGGLTAILAGAALALFATSSGGRPSSDTASAAPPPQGSHHNKATAAATPSATTSSTTTPSAANTTTAGTTTAGTTTAGTTTASASTTNTPATSASANSAAARTSADALTPTTNHRPPVSGRQPPPHLVLPPRPAATASSGSYRPSGL